MLLGPALDVFEHPQMNAGNDQVRPNLPVGSRAHPAGMAVFLTDADFKFAFADGETEDIQGKAGQVLCPATISEGAQFLIVRSSRKSLAIKPAYA